MRQRADTAASSVATPADATADDIAGGRAYRADVARRLGPSFARSQSRDRGLAYLRGLLSEAERKHCWPVAEVCGEPTPYGFQSLLRRADWEADAVREELRVYVMPPLRAPHGVLVLDETGFLKKGAHSAGVARQYRGTAGTVENCQIGVFLADASPLGHVLLDRELYVPQAWRADGARCRQAGIPTDRSFATKPQLACQMLARAFAAGIPAKGVAGDRVSGDDRRLRRWLEGRAQASVLAVSGQESVWLGPQPRQGKTRLANLPEDGWTRLSAGDGATGPRGYAWRWRPLTAPLEPGWHRWRLVRRSLSAPTEWAAAVVCAPQATTLEEVGGGPAAAGPVRAALRQPKEQSAWTTMQCGAGPAGIGMSRSPCGRWPC